MPDVFETGKWLEVGGYDYHCFISWPHTSDTGLTDCAKTLKDKIESELGSVFPMPRVFLDEEEIRFGIEWKRKISQALCKSVAMVAICAPIYYHPSHSWCGFEWRGMELLSYQRFPGMNHKAIIPVIWRHVEPTPKAVKEIQWVDFSRVTIAGRRYYSTQEYRKKVKGVVDRIIEIAQLLAEHRRVAECTAFEIPSDSAFSDFEAKIKAFPFRHQVASD